jgi:hypothetical protein
MKKETERRKPIKKSSVEHVCSKAKEEKQGGLNKRNNRMQWKICALRTSLAIQKYKTVVHLSTVR